MLQSEKQLRIFLSDITQFLHLSGDPREQDQLWSFKLWDSKVGTNEQVQKKAFRSVKLQYEMKDEMQLWQDFKRKS